MSVTAPPRDHAADVVALRSMAAQVCGRLEPDEIVGRDQVLAVHSDLVAICKLVEGARLRMDRRVEETKAWRAAGDTSAAEYVARATGSTRAAGKRAVETSFGLTGCGATDEAVRAGTLSTEQAAEVTNGAAADPDAEGDLLDTARTQRLPDLRDQVRRVKAAADPDPQATTRRIHAARRLRRWTDTDGAYNLSLRTTALQGAQIDAALKPAIDEVVGAARRAGVREPIEAYGVDALADLVTHVCPEASPGSAAASPGSAAASPGSAASSPGSAAASRPEPSSPASPAPPPAGPRLPIPDDASPRTGGAPDTGSSGTRPSRRIRRSARRREAKVIVHVSATALRRSARDGGDSPLLAGERCEIDGVGPVPVATVRALLPEAFVAVVISDATDVRSVAHLGRKVTDRQRTALEARGYHCEVPGCASRHQLEIDHTADWAATHLTRLDDLAWLCTAHHRAKTHGGWQLSGPPRRRRWTHGPPTAADPPQGEHGPDVAASPAATGSVGAR